MIWNTAKELTNDENEKLAWQDLDYGEKHGKKCKIEKHTLQDLEYVEKTDKRGKEKIMVGSGLW